MSNCLVFSKKYANTTNISNAARRPVIVAAAVVSIRVMRNEYGGEIIDSFEIIPNAEKIGVSLCIYVGLKNLNQSALVSSRSITLSKINS